MRLIVIGSSSAGNGYILRGENESLILEAGCRLSEVKKALDYDIASISGLLVTHQHQDHAGFLNEYTHAGIQAYSSLETFQLRRQTYNCNIVAPGKSFHVGGFLVLPFAVVHDVINYGYLIHHQECGKVCFITDSMYSPAVFKGLNQIILEANYSETIIQDRLYKGSLNPAQYNRIRESHMSFENAMMFLGANDLRAVNNIVLIHLSDGNSNALKFQEEIQKMTGKSVHIADKNTIIELSKTPF